MPDRRRREWGAAHASDFAVTGERLDERGAPSRGRDAARQCRCRRRCRCRSKRPQRFCGVEPQLPLRHDRPVSMWDDAPALSRRASRFARPLDTTQPSPMRATQVTADEKLLRARDADEEVKRDGPSAVMRRAVTGYLRRKRRGKILAACSTACVPAHPLPPTRRRSPARARRAPRRGWSRR